MNLFYSLCGDLLEVSSLAKGSYLTARKPPWDGGGIDWDGVQFYQECGYG